MSPLKYKYTNILPNNKLKGKRELQNEENLIGAWDSQFPNFVMEKLYGWLVLA